MKVCGLVYQVLFLFGKYLYFLTSVQDVQRNEDAASYTCIAKNEEGYSANSKLAVSVMGKYNNTRKKMFQSLSHV
jgi:hypothetical protein